MWLKSKRAVFRQILAGDPLEAQICHFELANHHVEAKLNLLKLKKDHFEPKIAHFAAKIFHFVVENIHFQTF